MKSIGKLIVIVLVISLGLLVFIDMDSQTNRHMQTAQQGVLDLRNSDFPKQGAVNLDGEWEFYEGKLLEPADFREGVRSDVSYLPVPGTWKGKNEEGGMSRKGFGTYRLRVLFHSADEVYGLKINSIRMSHRLYINGKLEGESGSPAATKEAQQPGNTPYSTYFHPESGEMEIIIQAANHEFFTGGIVNSIQFGWYRDITTLTTSKISTNLSLFVILLMLGAYHLNLYFLRKREKIYLFSGLYLFSLSLNQLLYGEKIFQRLLPNIPFEMVYKALDMSEFLGSVLSILFFSSIDVRLISHKKMAWLLSPVLIYITAIMVLPYSLYNEARYLFFIYLAVAPLYLFGRMIYLYGISRKGTPERRELLLFIVAFLSLMIYLVDGSLYAENIVSTDTWGKVGIVCFVTLMNILLAVRFTNAFEKTEMLTQQLIISNQVKDEFLMHTSHEIRTPLHGIMNITAYLLDDEERNLSTKQLQNLWLIKDTSVKLSMLMQDLIDVTRLKHGELQMRMTVVNVRAVTQIVFDVLQFELAGKAVRLENQVLPNVWVQADENRFRQILYNLVHNAMKHTEKGQIGVTSEIIDGMVHVFVEDTGIGIPQDRHLSIFEYFERFDQILPEDGYRGMGIGLYISRKLIERMGGEIRIDWSEVGQGTRMVFTLPNAEAGFSVLNETNHDDLFRQGAAQELEWLDIEEQHEHTILIVDDEASNIHTLLNILKRHPYNVVAAFSAKEAMTKMKEHPQIDLVVLDVMMPGISGFELCRMLRTQHSILDLPILFATAKDHSQDIALGFAVGANDYVTKPFEAETLIARIQTLLAMKTSINEAIRNELAFHQAQIKPHFLYNALSSVISFCYTDGEKAAYLLSKLSQYLRYILDMDRHELFVPLYQELELIEAYVEIEKARFEGRFDFSCDVEKGLKHMMIPSLCIQPFVENAIRHGLFDKEGYGTVTLTIRKEAGHLQVAVHDDGVGIPDELLDRLINGAGHIGGIGISNIRSRLYSIPGAAMTISSEFGRGTQVNLCLPLNSSDLDAAEERRGKVV